MGKQDGKERKPRAHHPAMRHRSKVKKQRAFANAKVLREFRKLRQEQARASDSSSGPKAELDAGAGTGQATAEAASAAQGAGARSRAQDTHRRRDTASRPKRKPNPFQSAQRVVDERQRAREERETARREHARAVAQSTKQRKVRHKQLTNRTRTGQLRLGAHAKDLLSRIEKQMKDG